MDRAPPSVFADAPPDDGGARSRDSLFLMAQLHLPGARDALQVRVRNLSPGGLMAELPDPIVADAIEIEVRGLGRIPGRIAWQTEGRAGVAFDREIDPRRARKPIGAARDAGNVRPLRPTL